MRKIALAAGIAAALMVCVSLDATAKARGEVTTAPLIVSASRLPTPIDDVASSGTVISAETIKRRQFRSVVEALSTVPSLSVMRNGGLGKVTSVFTRGANAQHTLFVIDGVEMNDPSHPNSAFDPAHLLIGDVQRIEVLLGPHSTLYGADAVGGVVSIVTKRGQEESEVTGALEAGSFSTFAQAASARGANGTADYSITVQHVQSDGISVLPLQFAQANDTLDTDEHENLTLATRFGWTPNHVFGVDVAGRYAFTRDGTDARILGVGDSDSVSRSNRYYLAGNARLTLFDGVSEHRLGAALADIDRRAKNTVDPQDADEFQDDNRGQRIKLELQNDFYLGDHHVVTLGLETEEEQTKSRFVAPSFNSATNANSRTNSVYLQDQFVYLNRLTGTIGVRHDDHSSFGPENTWRLALAYQFRDSGTKLKGSYGTGFKAPSSSQLFGSSASAFGTFRGNPGLTPETSRGFELGIEQPLFSGRARVSATYFENDIKNLIVAAATTNTNIGKAETRGLETALTAEVGGGVAIDATYSLIRSENAVTRTDLLRRPLHKASLDARWKINEKAQVTLSGLLLGKRFDVDAATFARIRRTTDIVVDLSGTYRVGRHVEFFGRLENLFDRDYEEPDGFQQPGIGGYAGIRAYY